MELIERRVSFELAELLYKLNFVQGSTYFYDKEVSIDAPIENKISNGGLGYYMNGFEETLFEAPTQEIAKLFLMKVYNHYIEVFRNASGFGYIIDKADSGTGITDSGYEGPNPGGCWDEYEDAYEAGLIESCKRLLKDIEDSKFIPEELQILFKRKLNIDKRLTPYDARCILEENDKFIEIKKAGIYQGKPVTEITIRGAKTKGHTYNQWNFSEERALLFGLEYACKELDSWTDR